MKFGRTLTPILLIVMLMTQFAPVVALESESNSPQLQATDQIHGLEHEFETTSIQKDSSGSYPASNAPIGFAPTTSPPRLQGETPVDPELVNVSVHMSSGSSRPIVIPAIVDDSNWPFVEVSVFNPNSFWVTIRPNELKNATVSE